MAIESPMRLPDLRSAPALYVTSDYSGEHRGASFQVLSILITDPSRCEQWLRARNEVRREFLSDGRRMSFKQLRDRQRAEALVPWLRAADLIPGICFAIGIERNYGSMFDPPAPLNLSHPSFAPYAKWPRATLEKACRLCHFVGLTVAAMASPGQDVFWYTDEDEIASHAQRLRELVNLFAWVSSHYLTVDLRHLRVGTTAMDDGSRLVEDLASIPDLVAGAVSEVLARKTAENVTLTDTLLWPVSEPTDKAMTVLSWLGTIPAELKRLSCVVESTGPSESTVSFLKFSLEEGLEPKAVSTAEVR